MAEPVRLWSLRPDAFRRLHHHGYGMADAAARSRLGLADSPPRGFALVTGV